MRKTASNKPTLGQLLITSKTAIIIEIILLFTLAYLVLHLLTPLAKDNPVQKQAVMWITNVVMLLTVWVGLKIRGHGLKDFGFNLSFISWRQTGKVILQSIIVLIITLAAFILGSIIMANITGIPEGADLSQYDYMKDNFGLFLLTLVGVWIVSSFGEEIIYRAFLINRFTQLGLTGKSGQIAAVTLSSVIFGFVHFSWGPMGIAQTTFMGLALGFSYIYLEKRLIVLILAHAYMDTTLMIQMYLSSQ